MQFLIFESREQIDIPHDPSDPVKPGAKH